MYSQDFTFIPLNVISVEGLVYFFHIDFCHFSVIGDKKPLPWEMRVRVAYNIALALDHCSAEDRKIYHDLNAYRILFDEVCL